MLKASIVCYEGPYPFQLKYFNEHRRVTKLYGGKIYCRLLAFMNHNINTGGKYLPKNYLFQASVV